MKHIRKYVNRVLMVLVAANILLLAGCGKTELQQGTARKCRDRPQGNPNSYCFNVMIV